MKIAIIGHRGRMGAMLVRRLEQGNEDVAAHEDSRHETGIRHEIVGIDRTDAEPLSPERLAPIVKDADVVILCVLASAMREVCAMLGPLLAPWQVLSDITSVKVQPMQMMERYFTGPVVGTHPLFGPSPSKGSAGQMPVAITPSLRTVEEEHGPSKFGSPITKEEHIRKVEAIFDRIGATTFRATADEHDRSMAAIQGLNYISTVAYFATLAHDESLLPYVTPSFRRRMEASRTLLDADGKLFMGMFEANPHSQEMVRAFRTHLAVAASGDVDVLLQRALWWWE